MVKVAALFAACQLLAKAKVAGSTFDADVQAEVNSNADPNILHAAFPANAAVQLMPQISSILSPSGGGSTAHFINTETKNFNDALNLMIVESDDASAAFCIDRLGYGYISAALNEKKFFDSTATTGPDVTTSKGRGIWLTGEYVKNPQPPLFKPLFKIKQPCVNDHPDAQLTTTRQMCRMFAMIQFGQPENDADVNMIMQNLLGQSPDMASAARE